VFVVYDLQSDKPQDIGVVFELEGKGKVTPKSLSGAVMRVAAGQNRRIEWEVFKDIGSYQGNVVAVLSFGGNTAPVVIGTRTREKKHSDFEIWQQQGHLVSKSFSKGVVSNLLYPGLGLRYVSNGSKGKGLMIVFGSFITSSLMFHQLAKNNYQQYLGTGSWTDYQKANGPHQISLSLGFSAATVYISSQVSFLRKKKFFQRGINTYE
jgi:hypothetical protein